MSASEAPAVEGRLSLRIKELAITNFRTFRERTVIPFGSPGVGGDGIVTFHGDNGSGKSNAIAALDLFFNVALSCLSSHDNNGEVIGRWDVPLMGIQEFTIHYRDRPTGTDGPTEIEVTFGDARLGTLRVCLTPSGNRVRLQLQNIAIAESTGTEAAVTSLSRGSLRDQLKTWMETPDGPGSYPLAVLSARRRAQWMAKEPQLSLLHPSVAEELFSLRTALRPELRERWRVFTKVLERFATFQGKDISIERIEPGASPVIILEDRGRSVLPFGELSSGEQQIIVLIATSLLSNCRILIIEEPEISLDQRNQHLLRSILQAIADTGAADQVILESHVPSFDGPSVVRFRRDEGGATAVERVLSADPTAADLARRAEQQGAKQRWVTRDGYTELPEAMREDLHVGAGAHVWFLRGHERWEAWPEDELAQLLGEDDDADAPNE